MVYQPNIPLATDQLSKSQADIQGNFQALNTIASGIFDAPVQIAAPVIPAGDTGLFTLFNATTGRNEMYIIDSAGTNYPITASNNAAGQGWTYLPSKILMVWGLGTIPGTFPDASINYNTVPGFPGFSTANISVQVTRIRNPSFPSTNFLVVEQILQLSFAVGKSTSNLTETADFTWLAIGK